MNLTEDIQSLSHFKRETVAVMKQLKKTGRPMVLTVNGKAKVVVQDAATYEKKKAHTAREESIAFLKESMADVKAGRVVPAREAIEQIVAEVNAELPATGQIC